MLKKGLVFLLSVFCLLGVWQVNSKSPLSFYGTPYETYTKQSSSLAKIFNGKTLDTTKIFYKTGESIVLSEQYENTKTSFAKKELPKEAYLSKLYYILKKEAIVKSAANRITIKKGENQFAYVSPVK